MTEEIARLQGTWRIVSLEMEGSKVEEVYFTGSKIAVAGEAFTTVSMGAPYGGMFVVDTTSDPHKLDMIFTYGPHAGMRSLGIYKFDGDAWILCLGMAGSERPEDFVTKPGSGHALERLELETEAKPDAKPAESASPAPPAPAPQAAAPPPTVPKPAPEPAQKPLSKTGSRPIPKKQ